MAIPIARQLYLTEPGRETGVLGGDSKSQYHMEGGYYTCSIVHGGCTIHYTKSIVTASLYNKIMCFFSTFIINYNLLPLREKVRLLFSYCYSIVSSDKE